MCQERKGGKEEEREVCGREKKKEERKKPVFFTFLRDRNFKILSVLMWKRRTIITFF